ncbi:unnamed protein product [Protopolystoma xenopodis]|uniref:Uncharacterized protein n=1 Tax=Protopolystoma xenopodis TaxID=117903 RepID=A0A3S5CRZ2_9PLAT|nr:unnamed protein product [Protopolystoma xenopodis]
MADSPGAQRRRILEEVFDDMPVSFFELPPTLPPPPDFSKRKATSRVEPIYVNQLVKEANSPEERLCSDS